jgi:ABC-type multidrug transport system ATPase subunit
VNCIETENLVYKYSKDETVINGISLRVPTGTIYGFLGPNGAGKTTTLRLILGLLRTQQGTISIFGRSLRTHRLEILGKVGSLIESPSIYDHLTANENLALLQKVYRCPKSQIYHVLGLVGLSETGEKKTGRFSLGMKQRLSIAMALLHDPTLLILDEPINGLDPTGIIEVRDLLQNLNREKGTTIVISSHILPEVEKLVSHLGIISRGKLVFQGELEELRSGQQQLTRFSLRVSDPACALRVISDLKLQGRVENGRVIVPAASSETIALINRRLVEKGVDVSEIEPIKNDLERIFMDLVQPS